MVLCKSEDSVPINGQMFMRAFFAATEKNAQEFFFTRQDLSSCQLIRTDLMINFEHKFVVYTFNNTPKGVWSKLVTVTQENKTLNFQGLSSLLRVFVIIQVEKDILLCRPSKNPVQIATKPCFVLLF